jgi:hypothetical protein
MLKAHAFKGLLRAPAFAFQVRNAQSAAPVQRYVPGMPRHRRATEIGDGYRAARFRTIQDFPKDVTGAAA